MGLNIRTGAFAGLTNVRHHSAIGADKPGVRSRGAPRRARLLYD